MGLRSLLNDLLEFEAGKENQHGASFIIYRG